MSQPQVVEPNRPPEYPEAVQPAMSAHRRKQVQQANGIKETIESILIAFVLAFIFRAFVVEAFVIPTGSMAPTLLGAHIRYQCPDCGYTFDVNREADHSDDGGDSMEFPAMSFAPDDVYCPNCGYKIASGPERSSNGDLKIADLTYPNGVKMRDASGAQLRGQVFPQGTPQEQVRFGDRILVLKYAYLFQEPRRWDVVVFKAPDKPATDHYTLNFIKRLVAKPGESLMVLDGDIYLKGAGSKDWEVQTKPDSVQQALWRIIYDNDFHPQGLKRMDRARPWQQPWKVASGTGWDVDQKAADPRVFQFDGKSASTLTFDANADPATQTTNDYLVYNIPANQRRIGMNDLYDGDRARSTVSDLKLAFWYQRSGGDGPLTLTLSKRDDTFTARIDKDGATLSRTDGDAQTTVLQKCDSLSALGVNLAAETSVELTNIDYQVTLKLNGKTILQSTPAQYAPNVAVLLNEYYSPALSKAAQAKPQITISAENQTSHLSHIGLWRDIYYNNRDGRLLYGTPRNPVVLHHRGDVRDDKTVCDDDEYFVMGDNSLMSEDARFWPDPIDLPYEGLKMEAGRVPGRFMLGKAFFVYWPAGYKPFDFLPPIVPNFGDMRFIH